MSSPENELAKARRRWEQAQRDAYTRMAERDVAAIALHEQETRHLHNLQCRAWPELTEAQRNDYRRRAGIKEIETGA